jgi:single-stranded-DNA-specific exonuclease
VDAGQTRAVGGDKTHLKLNVKHQEGGRAISGIAFNQGHLESDFKAGQAFDALITLTENHFRGQMSIEIMVESLRPAE